MRMIVLKKETTENAEIHSRMLWSSVLFVVNFAARPGFPLTMNKRAGSRASTILSPLSVVVVEDQHTPLRSRCGEVPAILKNYKRSYKDAI